MYVCMYVCMYASHVCMYVCTHRIYMHRFFSTHINVYGVLSEALASLFAVLRACIAGYTQERRFEWSGSNDVDVLFKEQTVPMMMMMMMMTMLMT